MTENQKKCKIENQIREVSGKNINFAKIKYFRIFPIFNIQLINYV